MIRIKAAALGALLASLTVLSHAVFVTRDDVIPARVSGSDLVSDTVRDGVDTVPVSGTTGTPILLFSDLVSGPDVGLGDGLGSGVIVTVWGQNLGSAQGDSVIEYCDALAVCRAAAHVYYWKNANGVAPSGPANLYESHRMQEIAFSIPDSASGAGTIRVRVGADQTTLPFIVRAGNIYHVMASGSNSNPGTFAQPWQTAARVGHTQSGGTTAPAGSTTYFHGVTSGGISTSNNRGIYFNNSAATAPDSTTNFFYVAYPGTHSTTSGQEGFTNYQVSGAAMSKFRVEASNCTEIENGQRTGCNSFGTWGIRTDKWGRFIANYITDQPGRCASRYQGAIVGDASSEDNVSNAKIIGNEIEEYGCYSSNALHHTTYMTIRSAPDDWTVEPWEFGYNYLHDNHAKSGIHNFDQDDYCGQTSGPISIRNNVVINQAGPGIYYGGQCGWTQDAYIENNIVINAGLSVEWNGLDMNTGTQVEPGNIVIRDSGAPPLGGLLGTVYIRNNILWGMGWETMGTLGQGCISQTGTADNVQMVMSHNICINTRNYPFSGSANSAAARLDNFTGGQNVWYYSGSGAAPTTPSWDASAITADPLLTLTGSQIGVGVGSPIIDLSNTALLRDIYGRLRTKPNSNIGAVE